MHRLVGHLHMQRIAVGIGIDRHRLDAHLAGGLDDPAGDLATVGDQDLLEHVPFLSVLSFGGGAAWHRAARDPDRARKRKNPACFGGKQTGQKGKGNGLTKPGRKPG